MAPRSTLIGAGLTAVGLAGGLIIRQAVLGRTPDPGLPAGPAGTLADAVRPDAPCADSSRPPLDGVRSRYGPGDGVVERWVRARDGAVLRVLDAGAGPAVLLLHGITLSADVWREQLRTLPDVGLRAVAMDFRGHGGSEEGRGAPRLGRLADDVAAVMDALELPSVTLVGHSMGGMVALQFLGRRRAGAAERAAAARVAALGLVATSARPGAARGAPGMALLAAARPAVSALARLSVWLPGPSLPDSVAGDPLARLTFGQSPDSAQVSFIRRITARVPARVSGGLLAQVLSFDMTDALGAIAVPTAVLVGTDDLMTPVAHGEALAAAIPGATLQVLEGCGHMLMLEAPTEVGDALAGLAARARPVPPG